jgi:hypothetical protein
MRDYVAEHGRKIALQVQDVGSGAIARPSERSLLKAARRRELDLIGVVAAAQRKYTILRRLRGHTHRCCSRRHTSAAECGIRKC